MRIPLTSLACFIIAAVAVLLLGIPAAHAQLSLTGLNTPVTQDFTGYTASGFSPAGMGGRLDSDNWAVRGVSDGDLTFGANVNTGDYARGTSTGGVSEGGVYSFDTGGSNPALGAQGTDVDFAPGELVVRLQNDTGQPISEVTIDVTGWSYNDQDGVSIVDLEVNDGTRSVVHPNVVVSADLADMTPAWSSTATQAVLSGLYVADGATFEVRFVIYEDGSTGVRDEVAIDDLSISATGTPATCSVDADCDDGVVCNGLETCPAGLCVPGAFASQGAACGDQTVTDCDGADACDGAGNCDPNYVAADTPCSDGVFCNGGERCDGAGMCLNAVPLDPDDGVDCTVDSCDEMAMAIVNMPDDSACDDMDECTLDACDPMNGCSNTAGCTIDETCYLPGAPNPQNYCEICDPMQATDAWTALAEGAVCFPSSCNEDGNAQGEALCDANGLCDVPEPEVCPNGCEAAMCLEPCQTDQDCTEEGAWCDLEVGGGCSTRNRIPIADAGMDQNVSEGDTVTLDGRASYDPDGEPIDFAWTQLEGPEVTLSTFIDPTTTFEAPRVQAGSTDLVFRLQVSDGTDYSDPVETVVTVSNSTGNEKPVAVIEGPTEADSGLTVTLLGTGSSDPDGDGLSYAWSQESGPEATLRGETTSELVLTIPPAPGETVSIGLIVNDGLLNSELVTHDILVTGEAVEPQPEQDDVTADAGEDVVTPPFDPGGDVSTGSCGCDLRQQRSSAPLWALLLGVGALFFAVRRRQYR